MMLTDDRPAVAPHAGNKGYKGPPELSQRVVSGEPNPLSDFVFEVPTGTMEPINLHNADPLRPKPQDPVYRGFDVLDVPLCDVPCLACEIEEMYPPANPGKRVLTKATYSYNEALNGVPPAVLPEDSADRKAIPLCTGVLDYFPAALAEVAKASQYGNDKHCAGTPLHHARGVSADHADCIMRHLADRGTVDKAGIRHSAYVAWRALALLQEELEVAGLASLPRGAWLPEAT